MEEKALTIISEKEITKELDVSAKFIKDMEKQAKELVITGIDDKDGYANVNTALKTVKEKRTSVDNKRKELKAPALDFNKKVEAEAQKLIALLRPIEIVLAKKKKVIDDEKELIAEEKRKAKQKLFEDRVARLVGLPHVASNGTMYFCGNASVAVHNIGALKDDEFEKTFAELKVESDVLETVRLEKKKEAEQIQKVKDDQAEEDRLELAKLREEKAERETTSEGKNKSDGPYIGDHPEHGGEPRTKEENSASNSFKKSLPNPSKKTQDAPEFNAIWNCIKTWDVNVPEYYEGYCGANGSHVQLILNAIKAEGLVISKK